MRRMLVVVTGLLLLPEIGWAQAYCGREDGAALQAARLALETGQVEPVLVWVSFSDEAGLTTLLGLTREVRKKGRAARTVADQLFLDTVARVHCNALGEPFVGITRAGTDFGPALPAAEHAVRAGRIDPLIDLVTAAVERGLRERWKAVHAARRKYTAGDLDAGRAWAGAYLELVDYAVLLYEVAAFGPTVDETAMCGP